MKKFLVLIGCMLMITNAAATGSIQQPDNRFYLSPMYSYRVNCVYCSGHGWFLGMGKPLSTHWGLELNAQTYHEVGFSPVPILQRTTGFNVLYFPTRGTWNPYIEIGAGELHSIYVSGGSDVSHNYVSVGAGVFWRLAPYLDLRGDIRFNRSINGLTPTGSAISGAIISFGLAIPFGRPPPDEQHPALLLEPAIMHQNTTLPVALHSAIKPVEKIEKAIVLSGVYFSFNSANLTQNSERLLNQDVTILGKYPNKRIEIAGYTDNIGTVDYNLKLSLQRAETVRKYFITHGVAANRLTVKGYGMADPIASNATDAGRSKNRRIELHILCKMKCWVNLRRKRDQPAN